MARLLRLALAGAVIGLSGCAGEVRQGQPMAGVSGDYDKPQTWLEAGRLHEEQGDLQQALFDYRLAVTVSHGGQVARKHLQRVEREIGQRSARLLQQAERAEARGEDRKARSLYLEILGLEPDHRVALAALRNQDKRRALQAMENKQALDRHARTASRNAPRNNAYADEGYSYSRQAILDAAGRPGDAGQLFDELGRHLEKYPQDSALRRELVESTLALAEKSYREQQWDEALGLLSRAELIGGEAKGQLQAVLKVRKRFARELYNQGVISYRNEPHQALNYWNYALKFDPEDEKSRLRIHSFTQ